MKTITIILLILCCPAVLLAADQKPQFRKQSDWLVYFDQRLNTLEKRLIADMEARQMYQQELTDEMHRMNNKLENRFDKYFLWGYGTLLVIISTMVSVIFNKRKSAGASVKQE